jgi:hypothetical protein
MRNVIRKSETSNILRFSYRPWHQQAEEHLSIDILSILHFQVPTDRTIRERDWIGEDIEWNKEGQWRWDEMKWS